MILTYKIRHEQDFSEHLRKAKKIAQYAIKHRSFSSKDVKHIGLPSAISNQILRKYGKDRKSKNIHNAVMRVPSQGIKYADNKITITCLKFSFAFDKPCEKVNSIEIGKEFCYVSVTVKEEAQIQANGYIGVDRNATSHIAVCSMPNGKVMKLGKMAQHTRNKYKAIRKHMQRKAKFTKLKTIKRRESNIIRDVNHKISRKVVNTAKAQGLGIKMEKLEGIRKTKKQAKTFKGTLHSWSFYQLQQFIEYKAKLLGVPVLYIDPAYTSKKCSRCGQIGNRNGKKFECVCCGHVDHADVNAAFNIAKTQPLVASMVNCIQKDDVCKGSSDAPQKAML